LYPASFRDEYGEEIRGVLARRRRDAHTPLAIAVVWLGAITDTCRSAAIVHWDILGQDLRFAVRTLSRTPAFTATAALVAALGIGATTAAFSVTDFVLIRPLPFHEASRLVKVWERRPGYTRMPLSPANYRDWKGVVRSFERFAAYRGLSVNLGATGEPQRLEGAAVTSDLLATLGVAPMAGRAFDETDDREDARGTLLLGYRLWQRQFGGDPSILGRTVELDNKPFTVIGIMPREFHFPNRDAVLWTPMRFASADFRDRNDSYLHVIARLRRTVSLDAARGEMDLVAARFKRQYPAENAQTNAAVFTLREEVSGRYRTMLFALSGAAGCVLLIACANLANLLVARALGRNREMAVRIALGGARTRLARQLLTESVLLSGLGGVAGVVLAAAAVPLLSHLAPSTLPTVEAPVIDLRVLAFAAVVTVLTGLAFGIAPLLSAQRDHGTGGLRDGARAGGGSKERLRAALVIVEIAASVVLLVSCGLLLRALWRIQATHPGFTTEGVLTMRTALPMPKYETTAPRVEFYSRALTEIREVPGISSAAFTSFLPMTDGAGGIWPVGVNGILADRRENQVASLSFVTPDFFRTLRIRLYRGRDVSDSDAADRPYVAVVSNSFAQRYWPGQDPIGRHFFFAHADRQIVGVVGDIHVRNLTSTSEPQVYVPYKQVADKTLEWYAPKDLVVRTTVDPLSLVPAVRAIIRKVDSQEPISDVRTLTEIVDEQTVWRAAQARMIGAFTVLALVLGGIGIHGLLSCVVSQRAREIGVRIALGAQRRDVVSMIARRSAALTVAGLIPGAAVAYQAGRAMQGMLAGVAPADGETFAAATGLVVAMTMVGSVVPALRAVRVDPIAAIRTEA
jgi:putative ABC transport system permease protein